MHRSTTAFVLLLLGLAGCASDPPAPLPSDSGTPTPGGAQVLDAASVVPEPRWNVGQWWEWETTRGADVDPRTFCSIVLDLQGGGATLVTENEAWAKDSAAFDHPLLGSVAQGLILQGRGGAWDLLDFPLRDGKTWTGTLPNIAWDVLAPGPVQVAMTATVDPALPGFRLTGNVEQGLLLEGTFLPATGWFGELILYDIDPGQEEVEVGWRAVGAGLNYTGPYFVASATPLLQFEERVGFSDVPTEGGEPYTEAPQPYHAFTMADGTHLYGYIVAASFGGARSVVLVEPSNDQRVVTAPGTPEGEAFLGIDEPGQAGEWRLTTAGAGGFSGAFVELFELLMLEGVMGPAS